MRLGRVYLVGAGPGDPGLLTVRGLELLRRAQVIVFDQLVNPDLLEEASAGAMKIFAGKRAGRHCIAQSEINQALIDHAALGYEVVHSKAAIHSCSAAAAKRPKPWQPPVFLSRLFQASARPWLCLPMRAFH